MKENPNLSRYLRLNEMARDPQRPPERRDLLKKTALDMLSNTTNIEGVHFMPPQEHVVFMAALVEHGQQQLDEGKDLKVAV